MITSLAHLQLNVRPENLPFYRSLMAFVGWKTLFDGNLGPPANLQMLGVAGSNDASLWFIGFTKEAANDYDGPGTNHVAIGAGSQSDVDAVVSYLAQHGVERLFETPRHRPEFAGGPDQTYYQVMFASPDRLLFEVVYTGPKQP